MKQLIKIYICIALALFYLSNMSFGQTNKVIIQDSIIGIILEDGSFDTIMTTRENFHSIIDFKFLNDSEVIFIEDIVVTVCYYHFKKIDARWQLLKFVPMGQTPQSRLRSASAIPKDYDQLKDKIVTFKINDIENVDILENGVTVSSYDFKKYNEYRQKYLKQGEEYLKSQNNKKN